MDRGCPDSIPGTHLLRLRRIHRTGIPFLKRCRLAQPLAIECGVRRPVDVLLHEGIAAPITCGMRHPAILLPFDARAWRDSDLRRSLIQELEHIRRKDWATQLAARAAVALYWFHPLVWIAWRQLCLDAERATDNAVVLNAEWTDYAEQLVGPARRMSKAQAEPAPGMANRSDLSARVSALLDSTQRRRRAGVLTAAGAICSRWPGSRRDSSPDRRGAIFSRPKHRSSVAARHRPGSRSLRGLRSRRTPGDRLPS